MWINEWEIILLNISFLTKITILWNGYPGVKDSARTWDWTQVCTGQGLNPEPVSSQGHQCHQYIILLMKSKFLCLSFFCFNWNLRKIESKQWIYVDEVFDNLLSFNVHFVNQATFTQWVVASHLKFAQKLKVLHGFRLEWKPSDILGM